MAAIVDKHKRIDSLQGPKMILAGGSNLAFGINSEKIEKQFGVPVVNLGLYAGLGLSFMVEELKRSAHSGDMVFLSIEYFLNKDGEYELRKHTSDFYYDPFQNSGTNLLKDIDLHLKTTRKQIKKFDFFGLYPSADNTKTDSIYARTSFNKYGDMVAHLGKRPPKVLKDRKKIIYQYWDGVDELNAFEEYARGRNVKAFFLFPAFPESEYKKNSGAINKLFRDLKADLNIEILNRPEDVVFPDSLFFDTVYHLTKAGREKRTELVIKAIRDNAQVAGSINRMRQGL